MIPKTMRNEKKRGSYGAMELRIGVSTAGASGADVTGWVGAAAGCGGCGLARACRNALRGGVAGAVSVSLEARIISLRPPRRTKSQ